MSPQRSVVPDPELSQGARGEPIRVALTGSGKLDDPQRDTFGGTSSSFFFRVPFLIRRLLLQCGQRLGGLICDSRGVA